MELKCQVSFLSSIFRHTSQQLYTMYTRQITKNLDLLGTTCSVCATSTTGWYSLLHTSVRNSL
jgi:hypothetical protein